MTDTRTILKRIGIGDFNASMAIPIMFWTPAITDPAQTQVIVVVQALQRQFAYMGAPVDTSGVLDAETARQIRKICGTDWPRMQWFKIIGRVADARDKGVSLANRKDAPAQGYEAVGFLPSLPDIPGGFLTIAGVIAGVYLWQKRKGR